MNTSVSLSSVLCLIFLSMPGVIKMYGTHLKASAAMVRLRLYDVLSMLPPQSYEGEVKTLMDFVHKALYTKWFLC